MRNLKVLIWFLGDNVESLNLTMTVLHYHYGIEKIDIAGVLGEDKVSFQGISLKNISPNEIPDIDFDYVLVVGGGMFNPAIPDYATLKKTLAEKINVPSGAIIFDFEIYSEQFTFPKVCLVVIFNHRFDRNLPLLRKIYGERFSDIRFLMPFYDGTDSDVIPVYGSSHQFHGYAIQAYHKLKDIPCTHYLFIGDDLIIHPAFDETNFVGRTNMYDKKFLDTEIIPLNSPNLFRWCWTIGSSDSFYKSTVNWKDYLYTYDEAIAKFNDFFGTQYKEVYDEAFFGNPNEPGSNMVGAWNDSNGFLAVVKHFIALNANSLKIPYPMARGYSDIFCLDKGSLFEFSRLCGIFSAMNLFVEIAIPTAAVLTYKREETEFFKGSAQKYVTFFHSESALILWNKSRDAFEDRYDHDFSRMCSEWNEKILFVHPIKLSRWKNI